MSYIVDWYVPGRVMYVRLPEDFHYESMVEINRDMVRLLDEGTPLVHVLGDFLSVERFPLNVAKYAEIWTMLRHPALGWTTLATKHAMLRFIGIAVPQSVTHSRTMTTATVQQAIEHLAARDGTVDWSLANERLLARDSESETK